MKIPHVNMKVTAVGQEEEYERRIMVDISIKRFYDNITMLNASEKSESKSEYVS